MKKTSFLAIIFVLGCVTEVFCQPEIGSVQGSFLHNSSMNIIGRSFGTKPNARPLVWENHEAGWFSVDWGTSMRGRDMVIRSAAGINRHSYSNYYGYDQFDMYSAYQYDESYSDVWYISFWFRLGSEWEYARKTGGDDYARNIKTTLLWNASVQPGAGALPPLGGGGGGGCFISNAAYGFQRGDEAALSTTGFDAITAAYGGWHCGPGGTGGDYWQYTTSVSQQEIWPNKETWYSEQIVFKASTTYDSGDGIFEAWANGKRYHSDHAADLYGKGGNIYVFDAGWTDAWWDPGYTPPTVYIYYDDVYIDNTIARVVAGDSPEFDNCTHQEIQIPTAWSDSSITITVNRGSFADGEEVYLFVVDANGNVSNSHGI